MLFIPFQKKFNDAFTSEKKYYKKYLWFLLFFVNFFIYVAITLRNEKLTLKEGKLLSLVGFFFFFNTSLFVFMLIGDWIKRLSNIFLKLLIYFLCVVFILIWLIITCIWIMGLLGL